MLTSRLPSGRPAMYMEDNGIEDVTGRIQRCRNHDGLDFRLDSSRFKPPFLKKLHARCWEILPIYLIMHHGSFSCHYTNL